MDVFAEYLSHIDHLQHRARTEELLRWVTDSFPALAPRIAWNQPMFTDHGTFIIGFSASKQHLAVAPEKEAIDHFSAEFAKAGYSYSQQLVRFPWNRPVDYALLKKMIDFNISEKSECSTFWRK